MKGEKNSPFFLFSERVKDCKRKSAFVRERIFVCMVHYSLREADFERMRKEDDI